MSAIRAYLEQKAAQPEREWLRRDPRTTHAEILEAVRDAVLLGVFHDDEVERFVEDRAGDLPGHFRHAHPLRNRLTDQLGHECYIARRIVDDERASEAIAAALADGYRRLEDVELVDGARFTVRPATLYSGRTVPVYGEPRPVRVMARGNETPLLVPKGGRGATAYLASGDWLVREGWETAQLEVTEVG